ncbi:phosphotransferase family protein [Saccharibacillus sacchari]|uniref:Phosphotransferase n=1 Tax=Saccharibacillus sacchari TaxID=456493 RepID=A0ACC6P864_9BACL
MSVKTKQLAIRIAETFFEKERDSAFKVSVFPILGKGFVNEVWIAETLGRRIVIRMNVEDSRASDIYLKEQWCMEQAGLAGIPGPKVLELGCCGETSYMIQTFENGANGLDHSADPASLWFVIGEYAARLHRIPVEGYGENLSDPKRGTFFSPPHPGSDGSWNDYLCYNIESLNDRDPLLELGVITRSQSRQARELFETLAGQAWNFGLNHGDLSLKNILVSDTPGTASPHVVLIDWGSAEVGPVPHVDLMQLMLIQMVEGKPEDNEISAFLKGYGLPDSILEETKKLFVLRSFDKLRWAIDCSAGDVEQFADIARNAFAQV